MIFLSFLVLLPGSSDPDHHTIRGTIYNVQQNSEEPVIRLFLLDESSFHKPYEGIRQKVIRVEEGKTHVGFTIENVSRGKYGLRCYQDENNNGKLDRFLVIPKEPWTLSWKGNKKHIPPEFEDISFQVSNDIQVDLYLGD
jgi:uncharacterized protein (DUF2141 family)